jgi:hypothetical protein
MALLYFDRDSQMREEFEHDSWLEEQMEEPNQVVQNIKISGRRYLRHIRKVPASLRRKQPILILSLRKEVYKVRVRFVCVDYASWLRKPWHS